MDDCKQTYSDQKDSKTFLGNKTNRKENKEFLSDYNFKNSTNSDSTKDTSIILNSSYIKNSNINLCDDIADLYDDIKKIIPNIEKLLSNTENNIINNINNEFRIETETFDGGYYEHISINNPEILEIPNKKSIINFDDIKDKKYDFSFKLDFFQKKSILCIENNENLLVSAHTSSGKTAIAKYAIAKSIKNNHKVIYTSPIKSLNNQKYREFKQDFNSGLMTGDVTINPNANCLIMTNEILRNMIFNSNEILKNVEWVIFDEFHYMNDKQRGVIWEETIILLPKKIKCIFLSATIPNARDFGEWICKIKNQPCNIVYTSFRPIPLKYFLYPCLFNNEIEGNLIEIKEDKKILTDVFSLQNKENYRKLNENYRNLMEGEIRELIRLLKELDKFPVIIFAFSKTECEYYASKIYNYFNKHNINRYISFKEQDKIEKLCNKYMRKIPYEDSNMSLISNFPFFLRYGIGFHHSGMIPILKEIVEILFQNGLIKILFSTETIALGINMPAKTVVFTSLKKYDGKNKRYISSGEFCQMGGRAGRRGVDIEGNVIIMLSNIKEIDKINEIINGNYEPLKSSFQLSFNQIVNLIKMDIKPIDFIKNTFMQYKNDKNKNELKCYIVNLYKKYLGYYDMIKDNQNKTERMSDLKTLYELHENVKQRKKEIFKKILSPNNSDFAFGRIIDIANFGFGILIRTNELKINDNLISYTPYINTKNEIKDLENDEIEDNETIIDVLISFKKNSNENFIRSGNFEDSSLYGIIPVTLSSINDLYNVKLKISENLIEQKMINEYGERLKLLSKFYKSKLKKIDLMKETEKVKDNEEIIEIKYDQLCKTYQQEKNEYIKNYCINNEEELKKEISIYRNIFQISKNISSYKNKLEWSDNLILGDKLKILLNILKKFNCLSDDNKLTEKGLILCDLESADELLLIELLQNNFFNEISEEEIAICLCCCLGEEKIQKDKNKQNIIINEKTQNLLEKIVEQATKNCKIFIDNGFFNENDKKKYLESFNGIYMNAINQWVKNESFEKIMIGNENLFEGNIIRIFLRIEELNKTLIMLTEKIKNDKLNNKLKILEDVFKRGLPFSGSLYYK